MPSSVKSMRHAHEALRIHPCAFFLLARSALLRASAIVSSQCACLTLYQLLPTAGWTMEGASIKKGSFAEGVAVAGGVATGGRGGQGFIVVVSIIAAAL